MVGRKYPIGSGGGNRPGYNNLGIRDRLGSLQYLDLGQGRSDYAYTPFGDSSMRGGGCMMHAHSLRPFQSHSYFDLLFHARLSILQLDLCSIYAA